MKYALLLIAASLTPFYASAQESTCNGLPAQWMIDQPEDLGDFIDALSEIRLKDFTEKDGAFRGVIDAFKELKNGAQFLRGLQKCNGDNPVLNCTRFKEELVGLVVTVGDLREALSEIEGPFDLRFGQGQMTDRIEQALNKVPAVFLQPLYAATTNSIKRKNLIMQLNTWLMGAKDDIVIATELIELNNRVTIGLQNEFASYDPILHDSVQSQEPRPKGRRLAILCSKKYRKYERDDVDIAAVIARNKKRARIIKFVVGQLDTIQDIKPKVGQKKNVALWGWAGITFEGPQLNKTFVKLLGQIGEGFGVVASKVSADKSSCENLNRQWEIIDNQREILANQRALLTAQSFND